MNRYTMSPRVLVLAGMVVSAHALVAQNFREIPLVDVSGQLSALLLDEDTDGDKRITIEDGHVRGTGRGDKVFWLTAVDGQRMEIGGTTYLSNLLQELKLAEDSGLSRIRLDPARVFEPPADRISRLIRDVFWDELTRSIDQKGLQRILRDSKVSGSDRQYLYVPSTDRTAVNYYKAVAAENSGWHLNVVELPQERSAEFVRGLDGRHGLLSLALTSRSGTVLGVPFVVPGGRFNELYGWDSYFITLGLLHDGKVDLARSMVDNFVYEIRHYGAILNANRSYYLTRSQPPFLTSMIRAVFEKLSRSPEAIEWLRNAVDAAINEYENVWMGTDRLTETGLSRYFDSGSGPAPEVAEYGPVYAAHAKKHKMDPDDFKKQYLEGRLGDPELDRYFVQDRAMRESGHDTSYRLVGRCADLVTVDLNSLLYKIETDIGEIVGEFFGGRMQRRDGTTTLADEWKNRAKTRKSKVDKCLWNNEAGLYFDYDIVRHAQTEYVSATTLYPLWAGLASRSQAQQLLENALPLLEMAGGIAGSSKQSRGPLGDGRPERQWDYPYGWSPHQILAWQGLMRYDYQGIARRLAYRWLYTITVNSAQYNGTIPEKFDVVLRTHKVFAEYGNVGTAFSYITREGFGWTNASYQLGLKMLTPALKDSLNHLIPPEWIHGFQ